jgi:molecular chaperone HscB
MRTICSSNHQFYTISRPGPQHAQVVPVCKLTQTRLASTNSSTTTSTSAKESFDQSTSAGFPDISNHYTLFPSTLPHGAPPNGPFFISLPALRKEFLQIQSLHHPDKHPNEPARSKALALSALINNAYKTLADPLLRAQYLLLQNYGIDVTSENNSAHVSDSETLMEVMEAQERIEDAETQAQVDEIRAENAKRIEETVRALGTALEQGDAATATRECIRLKYWRSLADGLHSWEPGKEVRLVH